MFPSVPNLSARTTLTNLLWRDRYAIGKIGSIDRTAPSLNPVNTHLRISNEPKKMSESYMEYILPFRTNSRLREEYVNFFRGLRLGKLIEDLDALAGSIAYKHVLVSDVSVQPEENSGKNPVYKDSLPLTIVTASMDKLILLNVLRPDLDLKLHGCVTSVGKTSLEVTIRVSCLGHEIFSTSPIDETYSIVKQGDFINGKEAQWAPILLARFTMVAKDLNGIPTVVNKLLASNSIEEEIRENGIHRKKHKLERANIDLLKVPPTVEERLLIHESWLELQKYLSAGGEVKRSLLPDDISLPCDTKLQNVRICHPQERNIHSSVFGGYLMREAFELAYATAMIYIKGRPFTISMDDVSFKRPVEIGSILYFSSEVIYAEGKNHSSFQVSVLAEVSDQTFEKGKLVTNEFFFTFTTSIDNSVAAKPVNRLLPVTYGESMKFLQGRRRKILALEERQNQLHEFYLLDGIALN